MSNIEEKTNEYNTIEQQNNESEVSETKEFSLGETKEYDINKVEEPVSVQEEENKELEFSFDVDDEESEYEYVVPHYLRNGILITLLFVLIGFLGVFILSQNYFENTIKDHYINQGYILTNDSTATAADIREGKTAYVNGRLVYGTYRDIDISYATATASDILSGFVAYGSGERLVGTMPYYSGPVSFTPGTKSITIKKGVYISETIIITGDGNLIGKNIKNGINIFGVIGTYTGGN